eukprot:5681878-Prymnesium_polylepis.1
MAGDAGALSLPLCTLRWQATLAAHASLVLPAASALPPALTTAPAAADSQALESLNTTDGCAVWLMADGAYFLTARRVPFDSATW